MEVFIQLMQEKFRRGTWKYFPNTPMLAAIVKVTGIMTDEDFVKDMESSFKHKFAKKPEVIPGNMQAVEVALKEVKKVQ